MTSSCKTICASANAQSILCSYSQVHWLSFLMASQPASQPAI